MKRNENDVARVVRKQNALLFLLLGVMLLRNQLHVLNFITGVMASGYLSQKFQGFVWTCLYGGVVHLLCFKGKNILIYGAHTL